MYNLLRCIRYSIMQHYNCQLICLDQLYFKKLAILLCISKINSISSTSHSYTVRANNYSKRLLVRLYTGNVDATY